MVWNHYQHGAIQTELGDWQASYDCFTSALKCRAEAVEKGYQGLPREFVMHGGVGNACNGLGRHVEAERYYQKALDLQPDNVPFEVYEVNICLSLLAQGQHRYAEASRRCQEFVMRREEWYGQDDTVDFM
jgi:tetratricopeptide (TPR) repeat protein